MRSLCLLFLATFIKLCLILWGFSGAVFAQTETYTIDTTKVYILGQIEVGTTLNGQKNTVQTLTYQQLAQQDPTTFADLTRLVPAAHLQTNSRGESLIYLRNAGERQVALFLDGALLNIPWDYRIDLSTLPASVLGNMTVSKGIPSILYGTNVLGGSINFLTREQQTEGNTTEIQLQLGTNGQQQGTATHLSKRGVFQYIASVGHTQRDGFSLPSELQNTLRYQPDELTRTNTFANVTNGFLRGVWSPLENTQLGLTFLYTDASKGIAPEGHDREARNVRFWQYPDIKNLMWIFNGATSLNQETLLKGSLWHGRFQQTIDAFSNETYLERIAQEKNWDNTTGLRLMWSRKLPSGSLKSVLNALTATHDQQDTDVQTSEKRNETYQQQTVSGGLEYEHYFLDTFSLDGGGTLDWQRMPQTGEKPALPSFLDYSFRLSGNYHATEKQTLTIALGRKTRFPTLRELFGVALNQFVINEALKPENAILSEASLKHQDQHFSGELILFYNRIRNTIDQRNITLDGIQKRQRINLPGSRVMGIELVGALQLKNHFRLDGHVTIMDLYGIDPENQELKVPLAEKPRSLSTLSLNYNPATGFLAQLQSLYTGKAYSFNDHNDPIHLASSLQWNARFAYRKIWQKRMLELSIRLNNLTDTVVLPQLGLPAPGREIQGGIKLSF